MENETFIRKYLHAELTDEERKQFLLRVKSDSDFAEEVKIHSLMFKHRHNEFAEYVVKSTNQKTEIKESQNIILFKILRNVAAIFILAGITYFSYNSLSRQSETSSPIDIAFNEPYISPGILQGEDNLGNSWNKAIEYYSATEYKKSAQEILNIKNPSIEQQLYLGLSNLYQNPPKFEESISILTKIVDHPANLDQDATIWYLSIAYLKNNQKELAMPLLKNVANSRHYKHKEATDILNYIENL